ncbi:MAG: putative transposase [Pseudomonadales bacterium]|jgi:putative transposase
MKVVMTETMIMKQQLIVMNRGRARAPKLRTSDRFLIGLLAHFIDEKRLPKVAVIIRPATILSFQKALVKIKYNRLYSKKTKKKPGKNQVKTR